MLSQEERRKVCWENAQKSRKHNDYYIENNYVFVKMRNTDHEMICDVKDWEYLKKYSWIETPYGYCVTTINGKKTRCHNVIVKSTQGFFVDHINGNRLDNRRENLRLATTHANSINTKLSKANKSGYKGVRQTKNGRWHAYIGRDRKIINLGIYDDIESAIKARKDGEQKYHVPIIVEETQKCDFLI